MGDHKKDNHGTGHIVQSLVVNLLIAVVKAVAAVITKSGAMLAEAIHSFSDCGNQMLLLIGVKQSRKPADASHPFGYGRALYLWSFMVALMLFVGGGVFSVYEGVHKIRHPEPVESPLIGVAILGISLVLEGYATFSNIRELNGRRGDVGFFTFLSTTKDSDLVVVFGENAAAVLGLAFALVALGLAASTGDGRYDGGGSLVIGLVLIGVAIFLAREVHSLLLGEAGDPIIEENTKRIVGETPGCDGIIHYRSVQQGAGEVMVAMKVAFQADLTLARVASSIDEIEAKLRALHPDVRYLFVEPDVRH
ncbi:MAG: cation diffusion facilitator family transporter [Proteobacteria bacterium]|nr:MAG: cation diffusion facilitator family transporter [Pseudomonadota bacterium]